MTLAAELQTIRERIEGATEGPWESGNDVDGADEAFWYNVETAKGDPVAETPGGGDQNYANAEFIAHARTDLPRLLHVLDEVLEVHRPTDMFDEKVCAECLEYDPSCPSGPAPWPCFTVRTITRALEGK